MNPKLILCFPIVMNCLLIGCTTDRAPHIAGTWKVSGTDNVLTLRKMDHSARLASNGKTIVGTYYFNLAPDLLKVTFPGNAPQSAEQTIIYLVPLDGRKGRMLTVFGDTESKKQ
jgi:hypothetical protein